MVAGQIFIDSEDPEALAEDGDGFGEEDKERTLESLSSLELSALLNKDLEEVEAEKTGDCVGY